MWEPSAKSKGRSGSCEQNISLHPFIWWGIKVLLEDTSVERCLNALLGERTNKRGALLWITLLCACWRAQLLWQTLSWLFVQKPWGPHANKQKGERTSQNPGFSHWADCISQLTYTDAAVRPEPIYMQADGLEKVYSPWLKWCRQTCSVKGFTYSTSMLTYTLRQILFKIIQLQQS